MITLTFEEYENLGGTCPQKQYNRMQIEAQVVMTKLQNLYIVSYLSDNAEKMAMVSFTDSAYTSFLASQSFGKTSIKVGSYSETQSAASADGMTGGDPLASYVGILGRYAILYRKKIGWIG